LAKGNLAVVIAVRCRRLEQEGQELAQTYQTGPGRSP